MLFLKYTFSCSLVGDAKYDMFRTFFSLQESLINKQHPSLASTDVSVKTETNIQTTRDGNTENSGPSLTFLVKM
jgi:hypothetical protein